MTTIRSEKLYAMPDGPPRDAEYEEKDSERTFTEVVFSGLSYVDHHAYQQLCIVFGDFSKKEYLKHTAMIKINQGSGVYYVYATLAGEQYLESPTQELYVNWVSASFDLGVWTRACPPEIKSKTKIAIAGIGAIGGIYATKFYIRICKDTSLWGIPFRLIIQSCTLFSNYMTILLSASLICAGRVFIVAPYNRSVDEELGSEIKNKIAHSIYKNAVILFRLIGILTIMVIAYSR